MSRIDVEYTYTELSRQLSVYFATQEDIDTILDKYKNTQIDEIIIQGDEIDTLNIPEGVTRVICCGVALRHVNLPDSVEVAFLDDNKLREVVLPGKIKRVSLKNNLISFLSFREPTNSPSQLEALNLFDNRLQKLIFKPPPTLYKMNIYKNEFLHTIDEDLRHHMDTMCDSDFEDM